VSLLSLAWLGRRPETFAWRRHQRSTPVGAFRRWRAYDDLVPEPIDHIDELRRSKRRVAVATLVNTHGTTPRKEGARMVVGERGDIVGSVTIGGCVDAQVIEEAEDVLTTMRPRLLELNLGDEEALHRELSALVGGR